MIFFPSPVIRGFYASSLTDLTNYHKLLVTHFLGMRTIQVRYNNVTMNLIHVVKMIKKQKHEFQFTISLFIGVVEMDRKMKYFESFGI